MADSSAGSVRNMVAPRGRAYFVRGLDSGAPAPQPAITPQDERQAVLIPGPARVFRQLHFLLDRIPAFALARGGPHRGRSILHESEEVLHVLLGAKAAAGLARMTGDQPLPVHHVQLLQ